MKISMCLIFFLSISSWASSENKNKYVLPLSSLQISELSILNHQGSIEVLGTSKRSAHIIFQRYDGRPFSDKSYLPQVKNKGASSVEISPPRKEKNYISPLKMQIYLPRLTTLKIEGSASKITLREVPHLKQVVINVGQMELNLYQPKINFEIKSQSASIFISDCRTCRGQLQVSAGRLYIKQSSGQFNIAGDNLEIISNHLKGDQIYVLDAGQLNIYGAEGSVSVKGASPAIHIRQGLPESVSLQTRTGNMLIEVKDWTAASWDIQAPLGYVSGLPISLKPHRLQKNNREEIKRTLLQAKKKIILHTQSGKIQIIEMQ
jgi:hypothetical protein